MVYRDRYIPIYKFKYVYVHIRVRQQLEYTLKSKTKKEKRDPLVSVGNTCWGVRKIGGSPRTQVHKIQSAIRERWETRNLQKTALASKVVNTFTRALGPPFIGRQRDFYIPRLPSNLENIPSVYMNAFYIP
jgi:hypothetical protein